MEIRGTHPQVVHSAAPSDGSLQWDGAEQDDALELLTVDDVAALLKVSKSWVYEHTRSRGTPRAQRLPHVKVGKYLRFEARAIRVFIEKQCRTT